MNKHELQGGARHLGGTIEKAAGDVVEKRDWQVGGVVNQVAGSAETLLGRAQDIAGDIADAAPQLADEARDRLDHVADRTTDIARRGARAVRADGATTTIVAAALGGLALGWLLFARRR